MKALKLLGFALGATIALAMAAPFVHADESYQMTNLTINEPFHIPGNRVLVPGTYWFQTLANMGLASNVVEIYNADHSQLIATMLTRPTDRIEPTDTTELQFATSSGSPATLVRWFYPGRVTGQTFVYSRGREQKIQNENLETVIANRAGVVG